MGVRWLMETSCGGYRGGERKLTSLSEPERASELRICQVWSRAGRRYRAETGGLIKGLSWNQNSWLPCCTSHPQARNQSLISRRKAMRPYGKSKVSVVHLGTLQVICVFWPLRTATSQLASCTLTVSSGEACLCPNTPMYTELKLLLPRRQEDRWNLFSLLCLLSLKPSYYQMLRISMFLSSFWLLIEYLSAMWQIFTNGSRFYFQSNSLLLTQS